MDNTNEMFFRESHAVHVDKINIKLYDIFQN